MQIRVLQPADDMDSGQRTQSRAFPTKTLKTLLISLFFVFIFLILSAYSLRGFRLQTSTFQFCFDEQGGGALSRWIKPPSYLSHDMTDEELFWRASFVPQVHKYPFKRVPKIAFMFLTIGPVPLYPIWEEFFKGHKGLYSVYIHSMPYYKPNFPSSSIFYRRQIPSQVSQWGKMSMCDAERRLLANALLDISNEHFVLLSESCIPLFNFSIIYRYLVGSWYSFVGSFDDPGPYGRGRYNDNMAPEVNISQWRKSSQWFEVNRELAVVIVKDSKYYPKFRDFCKPHCYVDEHYFPTMLAIETPERIANRSVTWVDWSRGGAHPATFGRIDVTEAFLRRIVEGGKCFYNDQPSTLCHLFARKFAPSSLEPLLRLSPKVLGFGEARGGSE